MTSSPRVGVVCSRFPKLSETFILDEMLALGERDIDVVAMPLHLRRSGRRHAGAEPLVAGALAGDPWSPETVTAQLHWLRRAPRSYLRAWAGALRGTWRSPGFFVRALLVVPLGARIARDVERHGIDHLHAHYATHPALACWVARRLTGVPWSMTVHAHDIWVDRTMLGTKAADAAWVIAISELGAQVVRAADDRARVEVVHCGVDLRRLRPTSRPLRAADDPLVVGCVASLEEYKGHEHLLRAVAAVRERGIDARLELAGDGALRAPLHGLARDLGLDGCVDFRGPLDRDGVRDLLGRCDAFALPSVVTRTGKCEGIPVALMEAMACALPVLATRVGAVDELVTTGVDGRLVAPGDPTALADGLAAIAADPVEARAQGMRGRRTVERSFDRARSADRLAALLRGSAIAGISATAAPAVPAGRRGRRRGRAYVHPPTGPAAH